MKLPSITIIGAGISGMSTALLLLKKGYPVRLMAAAFSPNITSNKAAAFWFPYHIRNDERGIRWCRESYAYYQQFADDAGTTGISMQKLVKVLRKGQTDQEPIWESFVPQGSMHITATHLLPPGITKQYEITVPLIETQLFLPWLQQQLLALGATIVTQKVNNLLEVASYCDIVVNCSGLGAQQLCNDTTLLPVRGQIALLEKLRQPHPIYLDNEMPLYVVPRQDAVIVGGTYEEGINSQTTEAATLQRLISNAVATLPLLAGQAVTGSWAGVRPYRPVVRVEQEGNIIHNYGHGGSGFTLAFGCAQEVVQLVQQYVNDI
jgi:D-amino-acid oxidase